MGVRHAQVVGSLPGETAADAMATAAGLLGTDLRYLPDGETGVRRNWVIGMVESFRSHPDLELVKPGDWSDYDRVPRFAVRRGHRLYGAALDLGIAAAAREARATYLELRDPITPVEAPAKAHARLGGSVGSRASFQGLEPVGGRVIPGQRGSGGLAFQVGIPGDVDLALFTFGPTGALTRRRPFTEALAATMHEIARLYRDDVVFQLEVPVEVVLLARAPGPVRPALATVLAKAVTGVAKGAPQGARFGVHLCLGDMNHRALGRITDAGPLVLLADAIARQWPLGRTLEYVHLPLAHADEPPSTYPGFYRPLAGLRLGRGVRFVAGFAHEDQDIDTQFRVRALVETAAGGPVDIATSCGLGRRTPEAALLAMERTKLLLADTPT